MNALIHAAQGAIFRLFLEVIAITNLFGEETLHGRNATSDDNIREPWKKCQRKGEFRDCMRLHYLRGIADKKLFIVDSSTEIDIDKQEKRHSTIWREA